MAQLRLDKYLADAGIGSRSQVKQYLKKGMISVNDHIIQSGDVKIRPGTDQVCCQGQPVLWEEFVYYMLNKPAGYVSATEDNTCETVLALIPDTSHANLFPVGRLDKDTEGLLLITNDGGLAHRLLSPKKHVDKTYYVEVDTPIPATAFRQFQEGMDIGEQHRTLPAVLEILSPVTAHLTIQEGKFHQVKRMFHVVGCEVTYLKRIRMGSLELDASLPPGGSRKLTPEELNALSR
ncbi:MAG: rRNA pseudouridine synthase [Bacteroides sp.]|nr:rRNA pseudouridine synthase [Bacteroides sp.]MCM1548699.1 rRNA pseudouridine synthase [Clostridium sp.]